MTSFENARLVGVMTAEDITGTNRIRVSVPDQPVLCEDKVRTLGDPLSRLQPEPGTRQGSDAAAVKVEYEPLPVIMTTKEALAPGAYQIHNHATNNTLASQPLVKGDADKALKEAKTVIEADFSTQINHQSPLEPEISSAYFEGTGEKPQLVIVGRSIQIHGHLTQIKEAIGYTNMRYKEAFSGGQFGIKAAITTEAVTAAAALHFKRPVRYVSSMEESILITLKRHAYQLKVKLAADTSGHITACFNDFTVDKGAYTLLGPMAMMRSVYMRKVRTIFPISKL